VNKCFSSYQFSEMYSLLVVLLIILITIHCKVSRPSLCYTRVIHFSVFIVRFHSGISQQDYRLYRIYMISVVINLLDGMTFVLQRKAYYCLIINQSGSLCLLPSMQIVATTTESKSIQTLTNANSCPTWFVFSNKSVSAGGGCSHCVCRKSVHGVVCDQMQHQS